MLVDDEPESHHLTAGQRFRDTAPRSRRTKRLAAPWQLFARQLLIVDRGTDSASTASTAAWISHIRIWLLGGGQHLPYDIGDGSRFALGLEGLMGAV